MKNAYIFKDNNIEVNNVMVNGVPIKSNILNGQF